MLLLAQRKSPALHRPWCDPAGVVVAGVSRLRSAVPEIGAFPRLDRTAAQPILGLLINIPPNLGYLALAGLVGGESMGIPLPGETALIAAGLLAHQGRLELPAVIAVSACAAIVGDNVGYLIGRKGGRWLLERPGPLQRHRRQVLKRGEPFFDRHGPKAVFLGRWVAGLRIAAAWLAGINHMRWPVFLFWNALGGIAWATSVGLLAYFAGHAAEQALKFGGIAAVAGLALLLGAVLVARGIRRRRAQRPQAGAQRAHRGSS